MHMRWPRRQPGPPRAPGPVTIAVVGLAAFAGAFGVARAAGSEDTSGSPAVEARPLALRAAAELPGMKGDPGPTEAELEARREKAREARERRLAKRREERQAAEEQAAREERRRLRAERRAEREAEAERELEAERRRQARERKRQQQEKAPPEEPAPQETTPREPPTTTTPRRRAVRRLRMIRETEQPTREAPPEAVLAGYRLDPSPRRREGGSLVFTATAPDGSPATLQVSAEPLSNRRARARFRRLARTRAELAHPALLGVREVGEESGRVFVAGERFPARSLADLLRTGPLDPGLALRLLRAVADGLDAAHAAGLVHRTLSGESVLLEGDQVKLDLFGVFAAAGQPGWGDVVRRDAHLHYESPEGARGEELGAASNVYSLTGLLVHALTGQEPFPHHDPVMITYAHVSQPPPKPSERRPELPAALDAIVARGMAKEPGERPESAGELDCERGAGAANGLVREAGACVPRSRVRPRPRPRCPRSRRLSRAQAARLVPRPPLPAPPPSRRLRPRPGYRRPADRGSGPLAAARKAGWGRWCSSWPWLRSSERCSACPARLASRRPTRCASADELAVNRLDDVRFRLRDDLAFASTPDEQADAADRLAMAYGHAADGLSSPELVSAAQRASAAYVSLEGAARAADEDAYESARGRVEVAESQIGRELSPINLQRGRK